MVFRVSLFFLLSIASMCESARILCIFTTPSISHQVVFRTITNDLAKKGHHLVILTTDPQNSKDPQYRNITEIDVHDVSYEIFLRNINMAAMRGSVNTRYEFLPLYLLSLHEIFDAQMEHPQMQKILNNPSEHFDLMIAELFTTSAFAFAKKFNAPLIAVGSLPGTINTWAFTGNPTHPIIYYDVLASYVGKMNFYERMDTVYSYLWYLYTYYCHIQPKFEEQAKRIFGPDTPHISELENSVDMIFINSFPTVSGTRAVTPATIYLGGMHIKPKKPLPKDIQKYLDDSKQGVIYFSLGSNVKSNQLPPERRQLILEVLGELPYNVMWKYEDDQLPNKPKNVLISKWFPQFDMLGHPNIKLFIFQGGQQSLEEAILSAVPLIGIPFIGDQDKNVKIIVEKKIGLYQEIGTMTKESFKNAIFEVVNNKMYKKNIVQLSKYINDDPMTPRERAVWWTEYVLRHKGAKHLRSPVMDLPTYQYFMLDIIGVIFAFILLVIYIVYKIIRRIFPKHKTDKLKTS